jgi:hypothetical protein
MLYLLDSSMLIRANNSYYPIESVPEFWEWLLYNAREGHVKIPLEIFEEIKDGPDNEEKDLLYAWTQELEIRNALVLDEPVNDMLVQKAITAGYASDLTDTELEALGRDPFLIAYAMVAPSKRVVVTSEVSKPSRTRQNRHVPDVCTSLGAKWCDPFAFNKALGFKTAWNTQKA